MYDFSWHEKHSEKTRISAEASLSIVMDIFRPKNILDIGCGDGIWLHKANELGIDEIKGVDGPWTKLDALHIPAADIDIRNLEESFDLGRKFDVAICLEVAEHLPLESANVMVDNLVRHSDVLLFSAAIPYQGGFRHLNEMWQSWWANKFAERGYQYFDLIRPVIWHRDDVHFWYKQNTLIYVKKSRNDHITRIEEFIKSNNLSMYPIDIVHPEKYEAAASYRQIAFKPLLRELPAAVAGRVKGMIFRKG